MECLCSLFSLFCDFGLSVGTTVTLPPVLFFDRAMQTVLDSGGKFFMVEGMPPVGCCPLAKLLTPQSEKDEMGSSLSINRAVMAHNELLQKTLDDYRIKHGAEVTISYTDYFKAYKTITRNLSGFWFSDGSRACCGVGGGILNCNLHNLCGMAGTTVCGIPDNHVQWDGFHLKVAMHKEITRLFLHEGFCKPSFYDIISGQRNLRT
ncbi:hypothetical protein F3Y22_tig00109937pilonHSYRG00023 [Hibiscus syriacus]|uniref:GDSL esterase/lipase n=1 Tax=Hibiscus syriacus TaxID=106335 RepID=A0A6A3BUL6_HIBSY|nr:GDSL esterase/lipase At3g48460-like [Hibiscus syriacus]KAE8719591.1 hypothetical protein F3Y22_tig00109937pilonHSYRG00023 [Hibiscus syriacus]